jgi:hypothetical protein
MMLADASDILAFGIAAAIMSALVYGWHRLTGGKKK